MAKLNITDMKTLIVDDQISNIYDLETLLKNIGFTHIDHASDAEKATEKMETTHYNIIFIDWNMPGRSGYNLLQQYRGERKYDNTAFVIISAESGNHYIVEALKAGATAYIVKPAVEDTLKKQIERVFSWINQRTDSLSTQKI
ncbi:MAG: response regulator [Alphaproteobacteria bacterium]|nr:response regulator [Alphaproteobacteria bacterium]